jgi:hypothetical protein
MQVLDEATGLGGTEHGNSRTQVNLRSRPTQSLAALQHGALFHRLPLSCPTRELDRLWFRNQARSALLPSREVGYGQIER